MRLGELIEKTEGQKLIEEMEEIAKQQVIISTPVGMREQDSYNGDPQYSLKG
jgi:hypothetical protein